MFKYLFTKTVFLAWMLNLSCISSEAIMIVLFSPLIN